jgi:starvation-inducible outer membrane lipoprotein
VITLGLLVSACATSPPSQQPTGTASDQPLASTAPAATVMAGSEGAPIRVGGGVVTVTGWQEWDGGSERRADGFHFVAVSIHLTAVAT